MESEWKLNNNAEISPNCPRCGSSNTKFCYYNNYSLTQPRYFCKGCRRYWTKGGSLRNVPVGGGCRKNRRGNKNLRQSIDSLTFKNSSCGGDASNNTIIGHSCDDPSRRTSSCSSSAVLSTEGPNIDLALVYANFLNQKPESEAEVEIENHQDHQFDTVFDPSLENSRLSNTIIGTSTMLPAEELALTGCLNNLPPQQSSIESSHHYCDGNNNNNPVYYSGFNCMETHPEERFEQCNNHHHDDINFELPPLPGEEEASHDHMMWSNSEMMVNHSFQAIQPPLFAPEVHHDDSNLLIGNWSPFDHLPKDSSFSKP